MELKWVGDKLVISLLQKIDYYGQRGEQRYEVTLEAEQVSQLLDFIAEHRGVPLPGIGRVAGAHSTGTGV